MRKKPLVFIVEDDAVLAKIIAWELGEKHACTTKTFITGEEMMIHLDDSPDIIILDYFLPGMTGGEVLENLREDACDAKIIGISGQKQLKEVQLFFEQNLDVWIEKDTDFIKKISSSVFRLINSPQSAEEEKVFDVEFDNTLDKKIVLSGVFGLFVILVLIVFNFFDFF